MKLFIAYFESDIKYYYDNKVDSDKILALSADTYALLKDKEINLIYPSADSLLTTNTSNLISSLMDQLESKIYKSKLKDFNKEHLINILPSVMSIYFFIKNSLNIKGVEEWIFVKDKSLIKIRNLNLVIRKFLELLINKKLGFFTSYKKSNTSLHLLSFLNSLIFSKIKKSVWLTGYNYKLPLISSKIISKYKQYHILYIGNQKFKFLKIIKSLIKVLIMKNKLVEIIPIINIKDNNKIYLDQILDKELLKSSKINILSFDPLIKNVTNILNYNDAIYKYLSVYFKKTNPKLLIAHQLAINEAAVLGFLFSKESKKVHLISHGAHRESKDISFKYEISRHARGFLYSEFASHFFIQQKSANSLIENQFLNKKNRENIKLYKSEPIMWGNKIFKNKDEDKITVLHASTFKTLSLRNLIYETSIDYYENLKKIINFFKKNNDYNLIIRLRDLEELKIKNISKLINNYNNIIISNTSIEEDLTKSNLILSYSSTVIEEALYINKNVGIINFNNNNLYDFDYINNNLIHNIDNENAIKKTLNLIENKKLKNIDNNLFYKNYLNLNKYIDKLFEF